MDSQRRLDGKAALITGAGSGIGKAIAITFGREGAKVMASDINEESASAVAHQIEDAGGEARPLRTDTSSEADVETAIQAVVDAWGRLDILVNNAGIGGPQYSWEQVVAVNQSGVFYGCRHGMRQMISQGGGGAIVNLASVLGLVGLFVPDLPDGFDYGYIAAKHAVIGLTKQFGIDGAQHRVRVNAICPGWIDTPLTDPLKMFEPLMQMVLQNTPMGRLGQPEEIARAALFLASDDSSFMTGAHLVIDGGWTAR